MDMGEIIGDAFKYPVSNWKRLLILGVLVLITQLSVEIVMGYGRVSGLLYFLIIPAIIASLLASGYQLRTLATSIMKEDEPPVFNEWTKMFLDGLRVLIVGLIYEIIPILILMAGFIMIMISQGAMLLGLLVMLLGLVILLIVGIIMVMAVSNMAYHDEIGAALRFGEIKERIKSINPRLIIEKRLEKKSSLIMVFISLKKYPVFLTIVFICCLLHPKLSIKDMNLCTIYFILNKMGSMGSDYNCCFIVTE